MKKLLIISLLFAYSAIQAQERAITLEDIWQKYSFYPKSVQGFQFMKNGKHYVEQTAKGELLELDFQTGARIGNLLEGFSGTDFDAYILSEDEQKILLSSETKGLYRHSFYAKYVVFDRQTKKITDIAPNGEKIRLATFNSKGDKVAYILANNIWYKDLSTGKNIQVTTDGKANEIITSIIISKPSANTIVKFYKVSKRKDLDISTVSAGFSVTLDKGKVSGITLAYGGMAATTKRATEAEVFLMGNEWTRENIEQAMPMIEKAFTPISDARSGAEFRSIAAKNLLMKFWNETSNH